MLTATYSTATYRMLTPIMHSPIIYSKLPVAACMRVFQSLSLYSNKIQRRWKNGSTTSC